MPIYEYICNDCETTFEVLFTTASSQDEVECSKCKSKNVKKVLSAGTIRSGSGPLFPQAQTGGCNNKSGFS
jgi:putative FmdB family regulatory protein